MRSSLLLFLSFLSCLTGQTAPADAPSRSASGSEIIEIKPDTVIATVSGRKLTAGEFEKLTQSLTGEARTAAGTQPRQFLEQLALNETLAIEAQRGKLDQISPYRERLAEVTKQILVQAALAEKANQAKITPEELAKFFEANRDKYKQTTAKVIFISRMGYIHTLGDGKTKVTTPEEAKEKIDKVLAQVKEGKDFLALAKEFSDDRNSADKEADLPYPIRANAANIPAEIRGPLTAAKPGEIVGPIEHSSGYYIFKVKNVESPDLSSVKADIEKEMRQARVREWVESLRAQSVVSLDHKAFWDTFVAANQELLEAEKAKAEAAKGTPAPAPQPAAGTPK